MKEKNEKQSANDRLAASDPEMYAAAMLTPAMSAPVNLELLKMKLLRLEERGIDPRSAYAAQVASSPWRELLPSFEEVMATPLDRSPDTDRT